MDEAKKQSIINAGFKEFGRHGYKKASVEAIVKEANISKGSLFYYFESKKNFYIYLYEYCGTLMEKYIDSPDDGGAPSYMKFTDFFERVNAIQLLRMKHTIAYPNIFSYMKRAIFETEPSVRTEITKINERYTKDRVMLFFQNLDYYKFKDGIDPAMVVQLLAWCAEGCANQVALMERSKDCSMNSSPNFDDIITMYQRYVDLLRNNFYKEEYL
ncbi:MAG TPA: TetR/AcrR family transcriptional regulator [Mobilitalea sp.]|nr:TetR/AcrR family transcriptional regulator [Mobilitalea sp.]